MRPNDAAHVWQSSAPVFSALGDATRLRMLTRLCEQGPLSITRLAKGSRMSRQAITKHLRVLEGAGLVHGAHSGRETVWQLDPSALGEARDLLETISHQWDETIDRLRKFVESR